MSFRQQLKTSILPKLKLPDLFDLDTSKGSTTASITKAPQSMPDIAQKAGADSPFIKIGAKVVTNIESLTIDETGFIPKLTLMFKDVTGEFSGDNYPKKNILVSLYIASPNEQLKPVRNDYLITSMKSLVPRNIGDNFEFSKNITYIITGDLFVPRLYNNVSRSYPNMSSKDALKTVAEELGLGFFENDYNLNDAMTWINPSTSSMNFIKHVADHAYQDDTSFFKAWISKELMLGMVDVNAQMYSEESDETFTSLADSYVTNISQDQKNSDFKDAYKESTLPNFITTMAKFKQQANYIYEISLISEHGEVLKSSGYKKQIFWYDHFEPDEENKYKTFEAMPTNTDGVSEAYALVPENEGFDEVGHKKWTGLNYGNTHENWQAARLYNTHNSKELKKIQLRAVLKGINFQVIRGSVVPVTVTMRVGEKLRKSFSPDDANQNPENKEIKEETVDLQLSGKYYVMGAKYHYDPKDPRKFMTELVLAKREWAPSKTSDSENA